MHYCCEPKQAPHYSVLRGNRYLHIYIYVCINVVTHARHSHVNYTRVKVKKSARPLNIKFTSPKEYSTTTNLLSVQHQKLDSDL